MYGSFAAAAGGTLTDCFPFGKGNAHRLFPPRRRGAPNDPDAAATQSKARKTLCRCLKYALHSAPEHTQQRDNTRCRQAANRVIISVVQEILLCRRLLRLRRLWGVPAPQGCRVNLVAHRIDVFLYLHYNTIFDTLQVIKITFCFVA